MQAYQAGRTLQVKRQRADDGRVRPALASAVDVNRLPSTARKNISKVECDYRRYRGVTDGDEGLRADVQANVDEDLENVFAQEVLWEGDRRYPFTDGDCFVIDTASAWLSKTIRSSGSGQLDYVQHLPDEVEASRATTAKAGKQVYLQKELVSIAKKSVRNALNDVTSLRGRVTVAGNRKQEVLSSGSAALNHISTATAEFCQVCDKITA